MKQKLVFALVLSIMICGVNLHSNVSHAKKKNSDWGKIAMAIHGDTINVTYNQSKQMSKASVFGGIIAAIATGSKKDSKAAREDDALEKQAREALKGWTFTESFKDVLLKALPPSYEVSKIIVQPNGWIFGKVDREFYDKGKSVYAEEDLVYDYTPLALEGIDTVIDVHVEGDFSSYSGFSDKIRPAVTAKARIIDLKNRLAVTDSKASKFAQNKKWITEFDQLIANDATITKESFSDLSNKTALELAKKFK